MRVLPRLTHQLTLEAPVRVMDGAGGVSESWTALGTIWAEVQARTGRDADVGRAPTARMAYRITVRGAPVGSPERPWPGQRLRDGARVFHIYAVAERDPEGRYLTVLADEEVVQ